MKEITAKEARDKTLAIWATDPLYSSIFDTIHRTLSLGTGLTFCEVSGVDKQLTDAQHDRLEELGYTVTFNQYSKIYKIQW